MEAASIRRTERVLEERGAIDALLARAPVCRVAVVAGGEPYVVPMNFAHEGERVVIHGAESGRLLDALRADPRVCFEVDEHLGTIPHPVLCKYDTDYLSVIGFGTARVLEDLEESTAALRLLARKYASPEKANRLNEKTVAEYRSKTTGSGTLVIEIELERMSAKAHPARLGGGQA